MMNQGSVLALTGNASDAVQMFDLRDRRIVGQREQHLVAIAIYHSWRAPMRSLGNSMTLGAASAKR